jgi:ATP-dependent protease HslVU (ClpYQ) peptidase subunit|nr:MAG TPA: proteasome alpha-type subunit 1 [Caudoviricetes sp.]
MSLVIATRTAIIADTYCCDGNSARIRLEKTARTANDKVVVLSAGIGYGGVVKQIHRIIAEYLLDKLTVANAENVLRTWWQEVYRENTDEAWRGTEMLVVVAPAKGETTIGKIYHLTSHGQVFALQEDYHVIGYRDAAWFAIGYLDALFNYQERIDRDLQAIPRPLFTDCISALRQANSRCDYVSYDYTSVEVSE